MEPHLPATKDTSLHRDRSGTPPHDDQDDMGTRRRTSDADSPRSAGRVTGRGDARLPEPTGTADETPAHEQGVSGESADAITSGRDPLPLLDSDTYDESETDDETGTDMPTGPPSPVADTLRRWARPILVTLAAVAALAFWSGFIVPGHNSGDDFALYIDQARSAVQGDVGATLARTRYAVDNSAWHTFSPYAYPWGLPLLLAPVIALTGSVDPVAGIDYGPLKAVIAVTFLVGLLAYHSLLRRRIHPLGAVLLPLFFAVNIVFVTHLDNVLAEFPFLMAVMLSLVAFDQVRRRGLLLGDHLLPLVGLGLLAMFAFSVRREGLGVMLGIGLGQLAAVWDRRPDRDELRRLARPLAAPWTTFVGATIALQLALPSELLPRYVERDPAATSGLGRIPGNLAIYEPMFAEQFGLKDFGPGQATLLGSATLGTAAFWALLTAAVVGVAAAVINDPGRELPVAGTFLGVGVLVMSAPFQTYRYIMILVPFLMYFAYVGLATPVALATRRGVRQLTVIGEVVVLAMIIGGWGDTSDARSYRAGWDLPQGPQQPAALEMFAAVRAHTRGDAIIVFHRARTMSLYTQRRAVQGGAIDFTERAGDYYVMYLNADGTPGDYSQYPLTDGEAAERGFDEIWRNDLWVIWRTPFSVMPPPERNEATSQEPPPELSSPDGVRP